MYGAWKLLLVGLVFGGVAAAQPARTSIWESLPSGQDFARNFPRRAQYQNISGMAVLCCAANAERRLDCSVAFEWPQGYGFGEATMRIVPEFRMTPEGYAEERASGNPLRRRIIQWRAGPVSREWETAYGRIREATDNICVPSTDEPASTPDSE